MSKSIPPIERPGAGIDGDRFDHPAFGFIRITRPQGGDPYLFMSNVRHDHKVSITIGEAEMERRHHHDVHYAGKELITVEMTTVQFADMMAGISSYGGVPCTLRRITGVGGVPGIDMENTTARYSKEVKESFKKTARDLQELGDRVRAALEVAKVSKAKQAEILAPINKVAREIGSNMPFMADMFQEAMEGLVQEAKSVVESFAVERGISVDEAPKMLGNTSDT